MAHNYFNTLNYSMANEDSAMEKAIVKKLQSQKILAVCGSGSRALNLLDKNTQRLDCIDLSKDQLSLARLRAALIERFDHDAYLRFWGYPPYSPQSQRQLRKTMLLELKANDEDKCFWKELHEKNEWKSLLYAGKWERSFCFFGKIVNFVLGRKAQELFHITDLAEQRRFMRQRFPRRRWNALVKIIGNRATFNALLYKGDFVRKNVSESYFSYYSRAFERLFNNSLASENFFLQLCLMGELRYEQGNPLEADRSCYHDMQSFLQKRRPNFICSDVIGAIKKYGSYDYISLSDVPSYFSGRLENQFLQELHPHLEKDAVVVIRSYLRVPKADRSGFKDITEQFANELAQEKTQMYRVEVLKKR